MNMNNSRCLIIFLFCIYGFIITMSVIGAL